MHDGVGWVHEARQRQPRRLLHRVAQHRAQVGVGVDDAAVVVGHQHAMPEGGRLAAQHDLQYAVRVRAT